MSRSLSEWLAAKEKWYDNYLSQLRNIEETMPKLPVIYQRESNNEYWKNKRADYIDRLRSINPDLPYSEFQVISDQLKKMAENERKKERNFLVRFYYFGYDNNISLTENFNNFLQGIEYTKKVNERMSKILNTKQHQKTKKGDFYQGLAPNLNSIFSSYIAKALHKQIQLFYDNELKLKQKFLRNIQDMDALIESFNSYIDQAIISALNDMIDNITSNNPNFREEFGEGKDFQPILKLLRGEDGTSQQIREMFRNTVKEIVGINNITDLITNMVEQRKAQQRGSSLSDKKVKELVNSRFKVLKNKQMAQSGGKLLEASVVALFQSTMNNYKSNKSNNLEYRFQGVRAGSSSEMTDDILLFSEQTEFDFSGIIEELMAKTNTYNSSNMEQLWQAYQDMDDFIDKMDEVYTVFINAKNKGIGARAENVTKTYTKPISELPSFLKGLGITDFQKVSESDFLFFVYNLGKGAYYEDKREDFIEQYSSALKTMAAKIMFDDYLDIGTDNGREKSIHLYYLSGKYIPASAVFQLMADAATDVDQLNRFARVKFQLPEPIIDYGIMGGGSITENWEDNLNIDPDAEFHDIAIKQAIYQHWNEEVDRARNSLQWRLTFELHLKRLLADSLGIII